MRLTNEEKVEIVLIVGNNYRTTRQAADEFNANHPERANISHQTVSNVMNQFKNFSVNFFKRGRDQDNDNNNLPVGYNEDDELNILLYLEENPKTSLRQISRDLNLKICFIRLFSKNIKLNPLNQNVHILCYREMWTLGWIFLNGYWGLWKTIHI